jgi:spore maturation protein CgeD
MIDLSIIVNSWNRPRLLVQALDSILAQEHSGGIQTIICDDGSNDETLEVIKTYQKRMMPCETIFASPTHEERLSTSRLSILINQALPYCEGRYISYLPDDDVFTPERTRVMVGEMDARPDIFLAYHYIRFVQMAEDGEISEDSVINLRDDWTPANAFWVRHIYNRIDHTTIMHRNLGEDNIQWDEDDTRYQFRADWGFLLNCLDAGKQFMSVPQYLSIGRKIASQSLALNQQYESQDSRLVA